MFCLSQPHIPGLGLFPVSYNRTFSIQELTDVQRPVHRSCELPLYFCWQEALWAIYWLVQNNRCWLKKQCETYHNAVGGLVHRNYKYFWSHPPSPFLLNFAKFPLHTGLPHFHNVSFYFIFFSYSLIAQFWGGYEHLSPHPNDLNAASHQRWGSKIMDFIECTLSANLKNGAGLGSIYFSLDVH